MTKNALPAKTEVLIVGAGPAGSVLARELGQSGIDVVLCDKARFPRGKTCGGGLTLRTLALLPGDITPVVERFIFGIAFTRHLETFSLRRYPQPIMVTVRRENFDHFLVQEAVKAGVNFFEESNFVSLSPEGKAVHVKTSAGPCTAQYVVGADGAQGKVAGTLGLLPKRSHILAIHSEAPISLIPEWDSDLIHVDWGSLKRSYAYVFPKKNILSMGAGGAGIPAADMKNYQRAFLATRFQKEGLLPFGAAGFLIPLRSQRCPIQQGRVLLVGDAAGLADPFTGEGIYSSVRSAQIAASVLRETLRAGGDSLQAYEDEIDRHLMPALEGARLFREIFNLCPSFFHGRVAGSERWWNAMAKILRGEKTFLDLKRKMGPLGSLLHRMAR
jgi:geranylgeranyl reductase family protein